MDQAQLKLLLQGALEGDHVKEATSKLKNEYYTKPESLSLLLQLLISNNESQQLRQLAATQARSLVRRHWAKTPDGLKPQIRNALLQTTLHESSTTVRHASANVIATIATLDFADGEWADLPKSMVQAASGSDMKEREVSTYIILMLLDEMTSDQMAVLGPLYQLFARTVQDPQSATVRVNTVLSLGKLGRAIDCDEDTASLEKFQQSIPKMLDVLRQALVDKNEENTTQCFDCFQELLDDDPRLLGNYFKDLLSIVIEAAKEPSLDKDARNQALNILVSAAIKRRAKFQSLKLSGTVLQLLWEIMLQLDGDDPNDDTSLAYNSIALLNVMACSLPPSQVVDQVVKQFVSASSSHNARERQVAASMLATCVEGAPEFMDQNISSVLPQVVKLMHDPELEVRRAAVDACNDLAENLPDSVAKEHSTVMQALAKNLAAAIGHLEGPEGKTNAEMAAAACQCMESLARGIPRKDIQQYLSGLVPHLRSLFNHSDTKIRETAITAVGSIANQARKAFIPYFADTMNALQDSIKATGSDDMLTLRGLALDTVGSLALAVGPEAFQPYQQKMLEISEESLDKDAPLLKDSVFLYWGTMASVYKEDFKQFLPGVTSKLLEVLEEFDPSLEVETTEEEGGLMGKEITIGGKKLKIVADGTGAEDADIEEVEIDEDEDWDDIANITGAEGDQEMALDSLAQIFTEVGRAYLPYFPQTIESITHLLEHPVENIRKSAMNALGAAYQALWSVQPEEQQEWKAGLPLQKSPLPELTKLRDVIMSAALIQYKNETDSDVIAGLNDALASILKICGPHIISGDKVLPKIVPTILAILSKQHPCQHEFDEDEDDDDDEEDEDDDDEPEDAFQIIDTALDVVAGLSFALGGQFASELWDTFKGPLGKYSTSPIAVQRAAGIGTVAECIRGCAGAITPHAGALAQLLLARAKDEDTLIRANAAYGLGLLVQNTEDDAALAKLVPATLEIAVPKLVAHDDADSDADAREADNWAGCVARIAIRVPNALPKVPRLLPALVGALPLEEDYDENTPVWRLLSELYTGENAAAMKVLGPLTEKVMDAAEAVLEDEEQLKPETRGQVLQLVGFIRNKSAALVDSRPGLVQALTEAE